MPFVCSDLFILETSRFGFTAHDIVFCTILQIQLPAEDIIMHEQDCVQNQNFL